MSEETIDPTPQEAVALQQQGEEIGFDTPEEVVEFWRLGGWVDNSCLRHAMQDLHRPTPEEAFQQQQDDGAPVIGFAFDTPQDVVAFYRLGGRVAPDTVEAMEGLIRQGESRFMAPALVGAAPRE